ncbi:MAG: phage antirepressor KilAC domain-containing protein [Aeromonadaceae bacterium]
MMNQLIAMNAEVTMSSREIAELIGKEHKHVMRDLRVLRDQLGDMFEGSVQLWTHPQNGQEYQEYVIKRDTCITLLTGYDAVSRMKVIKRWQELESQSQALPNFNDPVAAARAWADAVELRIEAEKRLSEVAPKVEFVERYMSAPETFGFRQVAKKLHMKENELREFLLDNRVIYYLSGRLTAYANHVDAGRFEQVSGVAGNDHAYTQSKFTTKGVEWLAGEIAKSKLK